MNEATYYQRNREEDYYENNKELFRERENKNQIPRII